MKPRCRLSKSRAAAVAAVYFVVLMLAASASVPRRVGDGGEYMAMALQMASMRQPAVSASELHSLKNEMGRLGGGFETSLLDYPDLIGADGRQDFLHFFLYPVFAAPLIPLVDAAGFHPNWAFTIVNAALLAFALFLVAQHAPVVASVAAFVSPIVWWVDKAHTEAFLFATVVAAALLFQRQPAIAVLAFALAGAQNAALGVTYPVFAALLWLATRDTTYTRRAAAATVAGAALVASPFLYNLARLGRLSPMAEYAQRVVPTPGGIAAFVFEPNIGIAPNAPVYAVALFAFLIVARRAARGAAVGRFWWWPGVIQLLLLFAWSQNPNANHGGTPGVNRWVLSLLALCVPWIATAQGVLPNSGRIAMNMAISVIAVMTAAVHLPARAESYREPTALAERLWNAGWMHVTPAEVFVERTQGREPAFIPAHDGRCRVLLIANEQGPVQCVPPLEPLPAWCRGAGAMCYAVIERDAARYVGAPANGFFHLIAEPSWPAGGPLAAGIHRVLREADPNARVWRAENMRRWRDRLPGAELGAVLRSGNVVVIYMSRVSQESRQNIVAAGHAVIPLMPPAELTNVVVVVRP